MMQESANEAIDGNSLPSPFPEWMAGLEISQSLRFLKPVSIRIAGCSRV